MKNFQTVVQELLHNRERQRRYVAFVTALCMIMAFTVSIILIEPAESMTGELACGMSQHIHTNECRTLTCGLEEGAEHTHTDQCWEITCGKEEHTHSENCYIHEDEQTAQIMQINSPQIINNDTPEGDSTSGDENISPQNGDVQVMDSGDEEDEYFKEVQKTKPQGAIDFPKISDIIIDVNGKQYKPGDKIDATLDKLENVSFDITYILQNNSVSVDKPYICYKLPDGIILPPDLCGAGRYVTDPAYSGPAGYYSISEDGLIVIRFTKAYIQTKLSTASGDVEGHIKFNGTIERNNTSDGDRNLQFNEDKTIHVEFPSKDGYFTSKSGKIIRPADVNGDIKIEWTVKVNSFDNTSFANGVITDDKFAAVTDKNNIKIDPPNDNNSLGEWSENEFRFNSGVSDSVNQVTFKYEETISKDTFNEQYGKDFNYEVPNKATLTVGGENYPADSTVRFTEKPSINKSAKNDYENNKGFNGEIYWTVVVEHPYGVSLKDYSVQDDAFMNEKALGLTLKDEHGETLSSPDDYTINPDTGTIKFIKDVSRVTITYRTKVEDLKGKESVEVPNNAHLIAPDTYDNDNKEIGNSEVKKSYERLQKLSDKTGKYLPDSGEIAWTIGAETPYNTNGIGLNEYTITDKAFANWDFSKLTPSDISATLFSKGYDEPATNITINETEIIFDDNTKLVLDKATNTIKVVGPIRKFSLTYKTKVDDADKEGSKGTKKIIGEDGEISVENTVSDKWGNSKTGKAPIVSRDKTEKKLLNKTERHFAETGGSSSITQKLQWQIDLTKDAGFSGDDLEDNVTATVSGGDGVTVTHYIDLSSIEVYYSTDGSDFTHQLDELYYTVNPSSGNDVTQFTLSFDEQVKSKGYHYIRVKYKSTVTMTPPDGGWKFDETTGKIIFTFDNTANGKTVDGNITVQDENHVDKTKIKVAKKWRDNGTESTTPPAGIEKVEFYIQRRSANTDTWETYQNDGTWGNDGKPEIYTLDSSNNTDNGWVKSIENLPVETDDHNNLYYYRAVEVNIPEGYHVAENKQDETGVNSESEPFIITNEKDPTIKKEAFDKDGNVIADGSEISTDKLAHLTYNGVDCYEIPYKITLENYSGLITFTDIIPNGFQLAHNQNTNWENAPDYQPRYYLNQGDTSKNPFLWVDDSLHGHYILHGSELSLNVNTDSYKIITYNIVIPVSELNGLLGSDGKLVENSISGGSASASTEFTITAGTETPDSPEENLLEKNVDNGTVNGKFTAYNGEIMYSVYANPTGKDIANGDDYDIHDILRLTGLESNSNPQEVMAQLLAGNLKITVQEVTNYSEDESGRITADVVRTLIPGEYSYNIDYSSSTSEKKTLDIKLTKETWGDYDTNVTDGQHAYPAVKFPVVYKLEVSGTPNGTFTLNSKQYQYDEKGKCIVTIVNSDGFPNDNNDYWFKLSQSDGISNIEEIKLLEAYYNKITYNSSADLTITVPDGIPLKITYSYTLKKPDGSYLTTNADEIKQFTASNEVSLNTNNASSHDSKTADFDYRYDDSATVSTGNMPKIVKYNVGNQGESLPAKFYIAQYNGDDGKWYFSSDNHPTNEDKNGIKTRTYSFTFDEPVDSDKPNQIPSKAAAIELDVDTINENLLTLDPEKLYKIIEVKVPNGDSNDPNADSYEANDKYIRDLVSGDADGIDSLEDLLKKYLSGESYDTAYNGILNKFISVRYFRYTDADVKNPPSDYNSLNVTTVPKNGTLGIPNNELIDITAIKTWDNDVSNKGAVEFTLYWSYTKSNNGIPNDATKATASDLGLTASAFENPKTVAVSGTEQSCTWENLPNGKFNGTVDRPIYYYIKETKYTVGTETYKLDETDNKFYKLESKDSDTFAEPKSEGAYQQFYSNNGINKSGEITVKNTKGLYVKKVWRTADNKALAADDIPVEYIKYVITGVGADGKRINIYEGTLTKDNNWTQVVPPEKLTSYTDFKVKEEIEEEQVEVLHGFNFSPNYNVTDSIGEITLVNKNNNPSVIDVTVNKEWSDGAETHTENHIDIWLYRTSRYLTSEELETLKNTETLSVEGLYWEKVTINDVSEWTLNSANGWTKTWEDLPYKGEINSKKVSRFYYYAVEKTDIDDYKATYSRNDQSSLQTLTIRNAIPGSLTLQKSWHDTSGNSIEAPAGTDSIEVSLYRREKKPSSGDTSSLPTNQIKIMALGDSITDNYNNSEGSYRKYFYDVLTKTYHMNIDMVGSQYSGSNVNYTKSDGTIITYDPNHEGYTGIFIDKCIQNNNTDGLLQKIQKTETQVGKITQYDPDIILLLIGTNDIMKDGAYNVNNNMTQNDYEERYTALINEIYSQKPGAIVFFMTPPPINSEKGLDANVQDQSKMDGNIQKAINAIKKVVEKQGNGRICRYVDLNALFTNYSGGYKSLLDDYCHPNQTGYELMGNFLAEEIVKYYDGSVTTSVPENVNGVPFDIKANDEYTLVGKYTIEKSKDWTLSIPNLPTENNGNDYVYYIVEETTGKNWTAAYTGNGQIIGNEGATITVMNTIDKGSIDVEKVWKNHTPTNMDKVEVQLYRSTTKPPTNSEPEAMNIMNEPMALAVDDLPSYLEKVPNNGERYILTIDESGIENNQLKYRIPANNYDWIEFKIPDNMKEKKVSSVELPFLGGSSYSDVGNPETLGDLGGKGFAGNITEDSYLIITLADGGTEEPSTEPQEGTSLTLDEVTTSEGGKNKTAKISDTSIKAGDTITVNLKYTGNMDDIKYINGCFGFSPNGSGWESDAWNTTDPPAAENTKFSINEDMVTVTWTVPSTFLTGSNIQFQIWYKAESVNSATYTVTSGGTPPTTEPTEPVDPEPTDSHIPTGAVAVEAPVQLSSTNNWKHTFDNLPLTDASGATYYYYVKEVNVPEGFEVTYSDGVEPGGTITITNTKKESSTTTMPSTGGNGAKRYYTVGGMLLLLSACGWAMHRRKRVIPH